MDKSAHSNSRHHPHHPHRPHSHHPHHPHDPWRDWGGCHGSCSRGTRRRAKVDVLVLRSLVFVWPALLLCMESLTAHLDAKQARSEFCRAFLTLKNDTLVPLYTPPVSGAVIYAVCNDQSSSWAALPTDVVPWANASAPFPTFAQAELVAVRVRAMAKANNFLFTAGQNFILAVELTFFSVLFEPIVSTMQLTGLSLVNGQLERGEAAIYFDPDSGSVTILPAHSTFSAPRAEN